MLNSVDVRSEQVIFNGMEPLFTIALAMLCAFAFFTLIVLIRTIFRYNHSIYKELTRKSFWQTHKDDGAWGEYLLLKKLESIDGLKRFLVNTYIPKANGDTTEIDVLMIHEKGIFVFESKNYSGAIYGTESDRNWTQFAGRKYSFYNPIKQNETHIKAMQAIIPQVPEQYYHSIIVFSERCKLEKIKLTSPNIPVLKRNDVTWSLKKILSKTPVIFNTQQIIVLAGHLATFSNASEEIKKKHVATINKKYRK